MVILLKHTTGEVVILTTTDSAVTLQHNSATKLNTTSSGVTVYFNGGLTATSAGTGTIGADGDSYSFFR